LCRAPQDIEPDAPANDSQPSIESPGSEKPPTPDATKEAPKNLVFLSSSGARSSLGPMPTLTPSAKVTPGSSATDVPQRSELAESPKTTSLSPQSQGLVSTGEVPPSGDSAQTRPEDPRQWIPCVADTLSKVPHWEVHH
jgi:hypothetical protein